MHIPLVFAGVLLAASAWATGYPDGTQEQPDQTISQGEIDHLNLVDPLEEIDLRLLDPSILEDSKLLVPDLIRKYGYGVETHQIQTIDGYLLEMHRITSSPRYTNSSGAPKQPVFLMHGLLDASSTFVIMGPQNGLAYLLADRGYDVWMGNARGNRYSRNHTTLKPNAGRAERRQFWNFSFHQVGIIDLPAMIDFVLERTNYSRLHFIGHSQATTSFFVMASELPEYNDKIVLMQALAPIAFISKLRSPLARAASVFLKSLEKTTSALGLYEFLPNSNLIGAGANIVCQDASFVQSLCSNFLFLIAGSNPDQLNSTMLPVIAGHTPAGASTNNLLHFGQMIRSALFRQYDHGPTANLAAYGNQTPPNYYLDRIRAPIALHYSLNDWMAAVEDVEELAQSLPNVIGKFVVADPRFNHLDFMWAIDVKELLYGRVFDLMAENNS